MLWQNSPLYKQAVWSVRPLGWHLVLITGTFVLEPWLLLRQRRQSHGQQLPASLLFSFDGHTLKAASLESHLAKSQRL